MTDSAVTTPARSYDVIVIGAGPVGENVADRTVQGGLSTLIVEAELVGGECSYWACMPSKVLLRSGAALAAARRVAGAAEAVTGQLDVAAVLKRRTSFTHDWKDDSQVDWLASAGIDLLRGHARLSGVRQVTVDTADGPVVVTANHAVVLSTGSDALLPDIDGLADVSPWTSRDATAVTDLPGHLAGLGAAGGGGAGAGDHVHARIGEGGGHEFAGEGLLVAQQRAAHQQGHGHAERPVGGGHLHGDHAAADDGEVAGQVGHRGGVPAGPR